MLTAMNATLPYSPPLPPRSPLLSADEFLRLHEDDRTELVRGVVEEIPVPHPVHGYVCSNVAGEIRSFVREHDLGRVMTNDTFVRTGSDPDTIRGADICYFSFSRLAKGPLPRGLLPVVPDLVIEVRSPSDRSGSVDEKINEYIAAGVTVAVLIDPDKGTVAIHRSNELPQMLNRHDVLTIPEVLPGFSLPIEQLFV